MPKKAPGDHVTDDKLRGLTRIVVNGVPFLSELDLPWQDPPAAKVPLSSEPTQHDGVPIEEWLPETRTNDGPLTGWPAKREYAVDLDMRDRLLDQVAIELFVKGWPVDDIYTRAEMFLRIRAAHQRGERFSAKVEPAPKKVPKR